jgi:hypothetical protein
LRRLAAACAAALVLVGAPACSDDDGGSREAFCAALPRTPDLATVLDDLDGTPPAELEPRLDDGVDRFRDLEDAAPDQIRDEVGRVADVVEEILDVVREHADDREVLRDELTERDGRLLAVGPAAQRVVDYARRACGVELGGS